MFLETFTKRPLSPNFCVPDERDLSTGSNFNPQNTLCMDACPDFIGVVNPPEADAFLELESRYSGKQFSKVSVLEYESRLLLLIAVIYRKEVRLV